MKKFTLSFTLAIVVLLANAQNWVPVASFPGDNANRYGAISVSVGTKGYLGLGAANAVGTTPLWLKDFWEYNTFT